ncbi:16159_t:CDS:1, partial [Cetraspora pellucida]
GHGVLLAWLLTESSNRESIRTWHYALKLERWIDSINIILDNDNTEINVI